MASKKYGTKSPEWWKHLRKEKRTANKLVRRAGRRKIREEIPNGEQ